MGGPVMTNADRRHPSRVGRGYPSGNGRSVTQLVESEMTPTALPAERALIGALVVFPAELGNLDLDPSDLSDGFCRAALEVMLQLQRAGEPVHVLTVESRLPDTYRDSATLHDLASEAATGESVPHLAHLIRTAAARRDIVRITTRAAGLCQEGQPPADVLRDLKAGLDRLAPTVASLEPFTPPPTGAHFLAQEFPPPKWLVEDVVPAGGCCWLFGPPKSLKSWSALDLALAVASGQTWLGRRTTPGRVWIVDAESIAARLQDRLQRLAAGRGLATADLSNLIVECPGRFLLSRMRDLERFRRSVREIQPALIVLDCWQRFHALDENKAADMGPLLGDLREAAAGAAAIAIHHARKPQNGQGRGSSTGDRIRGSSDLWAWADAALAVTRRGAHVTIAVEGRWADNNALHGELRDEGRAVQLSNAGPPPSLSQAARVEAMLQANPDLAIKDIRGQLNCNARTARRLLEKAKATPPCPLRCP